MLVKIWIDQLIKNNREKSIDAELVKEIEAYFNQINCIDSMETFQLFIRMLEYYFHLFICDLCLLFSYAELYKIKSCDELRESYKSCKSLLSNEIACKAFFYIKWADFEVGQKRISKALNVIESGIVEEAEPLKDLHCCMESLCEQNFIPPVTVN